MTIEKIQELIVRIRSQAKRFLAVLSWLLYDSMRLRPKEWLRLLAATVFMLGSNAMVLAAVYFYVRLLEHDHSISLFGTNVAARESIALLALFATSLLVAILVFSISDYVARTEALNLYRRYHEESVKRASRLLERLPDRRSYRAAQLLAEYGLRRLVDDYSRLGGWALRFLATAVPAVLIFFGALLGLILLDPMTTAIVAAAGMLVIAGQYPSNVFAATASNIADKTRAEFRSGIIELASAARAQCGPTPNADLHDLIDRFFEQESIDRYAQADVDRFRAMELSALWMRSGGGVVLALVLFIIGVELLRDGTNWASLIAYATLLRLILANSTTIFRAITMFSRFLPYIQHSRAFVLAAAPALSPREPHSSSLESIQLDAQFFTPSADASAKADGQEGLFLAPGEPVAVLTHQPFGKDIALTIQSALVTPCAECPDIEMHVTAMPEMARGGEGSTPHFSALPADSSRRTVVVAPSNELASLSPEQLREYFHRLEQKWVFIVYPSTVWRFPAFHEQRALVRNKEDQFYWTKVDPAGLQGEALRAVKERIQLIQESRKGKAGDDDADME